MAIAEQTESGVLVIPACLPTWRLRLRILIPEFPFESVFFAQFNGMLRANGSVSATKIDS